MADLENSAIGHRVIVRDDRFVQRNRVGRGREAGAWLRPRKCPSLRRLSGALSCGAYLAPSPVAPFCGPLPRRFTATHSRDHYLRRIPATLSYDLASPEPEIVISVRRMVGALTEPLNLRSFPTIETFFSILRVVEAAVTSCTGKASSPFSIQNPAA